MNEFLLKVKDFFSIAWMKICEFFGKFGAWFSSLNIDLLTRIFYALSILLLVIGFFKLVFGKKKVKNSSIDKTLELAENPEGVVKEAIAKAVVVKNEHKVKKNKLKNFFKGIWANKNSIFAIITSSISIIIADFLAVESLAMQIPWCKENQYITYIAGIALAILMLFVDIRCIVTKYGWETLEEFANRLAEKKLEKENRLNDKDKETYKKRLATFENECQKVRDKITSTEQTVRELKELVESGKATAEQLKTYNFELTNIEKLRKLCGDYVAKINSIKENL